MKVFKKIASGLVALVLITSLAVCGSNGTADSQSAPNGETQGKPFPEFTGTDFEGNNVDSTLFSNNEVTLLNFWFNGCSACVNEVPALEELNKKLREKGAELVGVNVEAGESEESLSEAKKFLSSKALPIEICLSMAEMKLWTMLEKFSLFPLQLWWIKTGI